MAKIDKQTEKEIIGTYMSWTRWSLNLLNDENIQHLLETEGVRGLGAYVIIVNEMLRRRTHRLSIYQVKHLHIPGFKKVEKIVRNRRLFDCSDDGFIFPIVGFSGSSANDAPKDLCVRGNREEKNRIKEDCRLPKETTATTDSPVVSAEVPTVASEEEVNTDDLLSDTQWGETVLMRSGFGDLLRRNWNYALKLFSRHLVSMADEKVHTAGDLKRYFLFFVTNATTGPRLRKTLESYELENAANNPYRFEDANSGPGHRSYHGIPLPDMAPPRPNETAEWFSDLNLWESML